LHGWSVNAGRTQLPAASHVPFVARQLLTVGCEQAPPKFFGVTAHCPVAASQYPVPQSVEPHALVPVMAHPPNDALQKPDRQPCPQNEKSGSVCHEIRLFETSHFWHQLPGLTAPFEYTAPPMLQWFGSHDPVMQTPPVHVAPLADDHCVRLTFGWHERQESFGSRSPAARSAPSIQHTLALQSPFLQRPPSHAIPFAIGVNAVDE